MLDDKYVIAETATSTWNYHLRLREKAGRIALCGKILGWDTSAPLSSWGTKGHIPASYCKRCEELAREAG